MTSIEHQICHCRHNIEPYDFLNAGNKAKITLYPQLALRKVIFLIYHHSNAMFLDQ